MAASQAPTGMPAEAASIDNNGTGNSSDASKQHHIRTYQACIPCRKRKVRCDLGPVDAPHDGPCTRCRRESKECYFSATRRKRKSGDAEDEPDDEYTKNNARKRVRPSEGDGTPSTSALPAATDTSSQVDSARNLPLTPGGHVGSSNPLRPISRVGTQSFKIDEEENERVSNETAGYLQRGEIFGGHDALNLLATASAGLHHRTASMSSNRPSPGNVHTPGSYSSQTSPQASGTFPPLSRKGTQDNVALPLSQPSASAQVNGSIANDPSYDSAREMWCSINFVNKGWFTFEEGVRYVHYFYDHIAPLTPVVTPNFRDLSKHEALFTTEPILAYTMVTVASRYVKLDGPGASSRTHAIHSELWMQLRNLISATFWGQDSFDDGFYGAGPLLREKADPLHRDGLRTLGAVESLLILTEWHPRALHFPTGNYDLLISRKPLKAALNASSGSRIDSWLKTCDRSDSMCWMLLAKAFHLAIEIGVFDDTPQEVFESENPKLSASDVQEYYTRKEHVRDLLQVYISQTSGRLGLTGVLPKSYMTDAFIGQPSERLQQRLEQVASTGMNRITRQTASSQLTLPNGNSPEVVVQFWVELAAIMHLGNQKMFPSRRVTRELIATGEYTTLLQTFEPRLKRWHQLFDACALIPHQMRHILKIEFEYARVYLYSLALQAVVQRSNKETPPMANVHSMNGNLGSPDKDIGPIPPAVLAKSISVVDRQYIDVVVDACRNVLKVVSEDLFPNDLLKHVPVRTYFRVISVMMILLKTFTVGASEKDIELSLGLFDKAVECLGSSVVDDIHIINSFTERATMLTQQIRSSLVRFPATGNSRSRGVTPLSQHHLSRKLPPMGPPNKSHKTRASSQNSAAAQWNNVLDTSSKPDTYSYFPPNHTNPYAMGYTGGSSNSLYGLLSSQSHDNGLRNGSTIAPTGFSATDTYDAPLASDFNSGYGSGEIGVDNSDWLTLPLDNLFTNHHGVDINQTTFGPDVGGLDLLDVLLDPTNGPVSYH